jgi:S-adenosylmethionine-dependent methyltransferase
VSRTQANGEKSRWQRLRREAENYAAYLETPEGRLRIDLAFANLAEALPKSHQVRRALDVGGGTGALAVRLAQLGFEVTLLDSSWAMLDFAQRAAQQAKVSERITLKHGDAGQLSGLFPARSFDVILCHNVLEFVDDPATVLCGLAGVLRGPSAILSVVVRSRAGEVFKAALQAGDLSAAENALTAEFGQESLHGGKVRLFTAEDLLSMLPESLKIDNQRGVRVLADYLPPQVSRAAEYERIFALELELGRRRHFAAVARYWQCLARPASQNQ